jgi:hypothetical protein
MNVTEYFARTDTPSEGSPVGKLNFNRLLCGNDLRARSSVDFWRTSAPPSARSREKNITCAKSAGEGRNRPVSPCRSPWPRVIQEISPLPQGGEGTESGSKGNAESGRGMCCWRYAWLFASRLLFILLG